MRISQMRAGSNVINTPLDVDSWEKLALLTTGGAWSPFDFGGLSRKSANFRSTALLVLDVDRSPYDSDERFVEDFRAFKHIITTTRNHLRDKETGGGSLVRRYRVILELDSPITDEKQYKAVYAHLLAQFPYCDQQVHDTARFFYPGVSIISIQETGKQVESNITIIAGNSQILPESHRDSLILGKLARSTQDFLTNGAASGTWNGRLFKAAIDAHEQGMPREAFEAWITKTAPYGYLDASDTATIDSAYSREPKYEPRVTDSFGKSNSQLDSNRVFAQSELDVSMASSTFKEKLGRAGDLLLRPELFNGVSTGFKELDRRLGGGLMPHTLTGLSAPGKTGKTTFLTAMTAGIASQGVPVGWLSLEMSPERHLIPSLLSIAAEVNIRELARDSDPLVKQLLDAVGNGSMYPWLNNIGFLNRMGATPIDVISQYIKHDYEMRGTKIFFIDHVGYSLSDIQDFSSHSKLAKTLRKLTDQLPIHIVAVVQPRNLGMGERVSKATLYGGAVWSQDLNQLLTVERRNNNQLAVFLTDSHSPMAETSTDSPVLFTFDRHTCSLTE
jgi:hypothetical protein